MAVVVRVVRAGFKSVSGRAGAAVPAARSVWLVTALEPPGPIKTAGNGEP